LTIKIICKINGTVNRHLLIIVIIMMMMIIIIISTNIIIILCFAEKWSIYLLKITESRGDGKSSRTDQRCSLEPHTIDMFSCLCHVWMKGGDEQNVEKYYFFTFYTF